jgi:hypothetical protein
VQVYKDEAVTDTISVVASAQAQLHESEALEVLTKRIAAKDDPRNQLLVISCGLPDPAGYVCPIDLFLFKLVADAANVGKLVITAEHLKAAVLHSAQSGQVVELFRAPGAVAPWAF